MTLLGLDFDNTLVRYDKLFHQLALEKNLIEQIVPANKTAIRDYLREQGKEEQFTLLQGEVYGPRILEAEPAEGMLEALNKLNKNGVQMVLVSHKTRTPYMGPAYDLHQAAWNWLEKYEFFVQENFEPYAAMHESRQHSNLWGKMVLWGDEALATDHVGYYSKNVLLNTIQFT